MQLYITLVLIGAAGGMLGALFGVGGGIIMVPALYTFTDLNWKQSVATSLTIIIVTSIFGTLSNASGSNLINWKLAGFAAVGAALAAYFGSGLMRQMNNETLTRMFAVVMILMGVKFLIYPGSKTPSKSSGQAPAEVSVKES
ncbi:MAG: putative membrane protein YfcA [Verrucomicrobiales bacterium]|jgi:uncharacterized membrane protein YfcA